MALGARRAAGVTGAAELSIQAALRAYMQQAPLAFAITRGSEHTVAYANPAFYRLVGAAVDSPIGAPIAAAFAATEGQAMSGILDRAFRHRVNVVDQRIPAATGRGRDWNVSAWPVIAKDGRTETLGIEIRESSEPDDAIDLQRQIAEQMLLGALRERGFAEEIGRASCRERVSFLV